MPHINIKYFSTLSLAQQSELSSAFTKVVTDIFQCNEDVVSIAFEPIEQETWYQNVYTKEIINRKELLFKFPKY